MQINISSVHCRENGSPPSRVASRCKAGKKTSLFHTKGTVILREKVTRVSLCNSSMVERKYAFLSVQVRFDPEVLRESL